MKKIAGLLLVGIVLLSNSQLFAQSYAESALLMTRTNPGGSARIQAMGGAQVSLGGDFSSAYSNPAGLGMYNRSEFTFSPGFLSGSSTTNFAGSYTTDSQSKLIIPGISIVFNKKYNNEKILSGSFGISLNRTNNFNRSFAFDKAAVPNTPTPTSVIDYFINDANDQGGGSQEQLFAPGGDLYNTTTELAWGQYLINPRADDTTKYTSDVLGDAHQHQRVIQTGSQNQVNFSYGANLSDVFYFGGGIGIASAHYKSVSSLTENNFTGTPHYLNSLHLTETISSSATGINATLGVIARPLPFVQIGASVATPTYYVFSDSYIAGLSTDWGNFPYGTANDVPDPSSTDEILADYSLTTPWRASAGLSLFASKYGVISADVEYLNYGNSKYKSKSDGGVNADDNATIKTDYRSVVNLRIGAEGRIDKFRVRAGYGLMPDPYNTNYDIATTRSTRVANKMTTVSFGAGYRTSTFFIDAAYIMSSQPNTRYSPYAPYSSYQAIAAPLAIVNSTKSNISTFMVTVGFPFAR